MSHWNGLAAHLQIPERRRCCTPFATPQPPTAENGRATSCCSTATRVRRAGALAHAQRSPKNFAMQVASDDLTGEILLSDGGLNLTQRAVSKPLFGDAGCPIASCYGDGEDRRRGADTSQFFFVATMARLNGIRAFTASAARTTNFPLIGCQAHTVAPPVRHCLFRFTGRSSGQCNRRRQAP